MSCPDSGDVRCKDGSCRSSQVECNAVTAGGCDSQNGFGDIRCHDGSCVREIEECTAADAQANVCPFRRPFRCDSGLCAISSIYCPVVPTVQGESCNGLAVRCADGTCAATALSCRFLAPCPR